MGAVRGMSVSDSAVAADVRVPTYRNTAIAGTKAWTNAYLRRVVLADWTCALAASALAARVRFGGQAYLPLTYLSLTCGLPVAWWMSVLIAGGYDTRFIGLGSDEFRRILSAAVNLTAGVAVVSYAAKLDLARGYLAIALPSANTVTSCSPSWNRRANSFALSEPKPSSRAASSAKFTGRLSS